uniref:Fusion protein n=1 Tax=Loa loa TaxID=7209 RepID=A0A1I7VUX7_LOALO
MDQDSANLPYKPYFIAPQIQSDSHPYVNRSLSSGENNLYRSQQISRISSHLKEHNLSDALNTSLLGLTRFLECHEPNPEISHSSPKLHFLSDSSVVMKPLISSATSHLLASQVIREPGSISNMTEGKEVIFAGTAGNNHIERPVPKKLQSLSDGQDQFTNTFYLPVAQNFRMISDRENDISVSSSAVSNTTAIDNEIITLKADTDSVYSKLNEIQWKRQTTIQTLQENEESKLNNSNSIVNIANGRSGYLKVADEIQESVSCKTAKETLQIYQLITNNNQNKKEKEQTDERTCPVNSAEEKKLEPLGQLCDTWENSGQFRKPELTAFQKPRNSFKTRQDKSSSEIETDEDIILVSCPQETAEVQMKNNDQNPTSNLPGKVNSASSVEINKNCGFRSMNGILQQKANKLKDQYRNNASHKPKIKNTITAVKRIQEFWDDTNLPSHIEKAKNLDISIQSEKVTQSIRPCLPRTNHLTQSPISIMGFQQPTIGFQSPVRFGPMLCFPNISTSAENHTYFTNLYNPFSQPESVQFLTSTQLPKHVLPTIPASIQPFQQHPCPLLNVHFPPADNTISAKPRRRTSNLLPRNSYKTKHKLLFRTGLMPPLSRKKLLNSKLRNAIAQTVAPVNSIINVPNAINLSPIAKEQNIKMIKNPLNSFQLSTCQQMLDMEEQSITMPNLETFPGNGELQQIPSTRNVLTMSQFTTMNKHNCFL